MLRIADPSAGRRYCTAASFVVLLLLAVAYAHAAPEDGGKRLALIIGNNAYSVHQLQNAVNDARAMNKALLAAGFRTIFRENAKKVAMEQATVELLRAVGPNDTVLFYYAGHAVQIENENMLIPVDFEAADDVVEAKFKSFPFAQLIEQLKRSRAKITIFILDACRSNPLAAKLSLETGLAIPPNPGKETYIAFSTSPNKVATDNPDGKNSWFTDALADLITKPNLSLDEIFVGVRKRVLEATKGRQIPWSQTSLTEPVYFLRDKDTIIINSTMRDKWFRDAQQHAQRENWPEAIQSLQDVLKNQPDRSLEQKAKKMLDYVMARRDALSHFEIGDFGAAARLYEQALRVDPFSMDAALEGFNSYLLSDQLPDAVRILKQIRLQGSSTVAGKAQAALKELAAVNPDAEKELKNGIPQPPPIQEILGGTHFGAPDWDAGKRYLQEHPAELARWIKDSRRYCLRSLKSRIKRILQRIQRAP